MKLPSSLRPSVPLPHVCCCPAARVIRIRACLSACVSVSPLLLCLAHPMSFACVPVCACCVLTGHFENHRRAGGSRAGGDGGRRCIGERSGHREQCSCRRRGATDPTAQGTVRQKREASGVSTEKKTKRTTQQREADATCGRPQRPPLEAQISGSRRVTIAQFTHASNHLENLQINLLPFAMMQRCGRELSCGELQRSQYQAKAKHLLCAVL